MAAVPRTVAHEVDDLRATQLTQLQGCGNGQAARLRLKVLRRRWPDAPLSRPARLR